VDVTNFDDITKNIEQSTKEKNIDIFVNNAGMAGKILKYGIIQMMNG